MKPNPIEQRPSDHNSPLLAPAEVRAIRYRFGKTQAEFAGMIGVSLGTLQGWEDGRHRPDGPANALLRVAARNPKIVAKALGH